jgi:diacylglycerol kinase family enzyme
MTRRVLVVMNPSARDFEAERRFPQLEPILRSLADVRLLKTDPDDAKTAALLSEALREGHDRVISIGGDGTAHLVLNVLFAMIQQEQLPVPEFAVIPFGTANDVAKSLHLPMHDLEKVAEIAAGDRLGLLDVGFVRATLDDRSASRFFVDAVTVGMDADVLAARNKHRELGGYLAYAAALAERAVEQQSLDIRLTIDGKSLDTRVFNAVINNVPVYAGELEMPGAKRDDGLLDVYLFNRGEYASKLMSFAIKQVDILKLGVHEALEQITDNQQTFHGRNIKVRLASPRKVQVDGEMFGEAEELECTLAGRLKVAIPPPAK